MKKVIFLFGILYLYTGCSGVGLKSSSLDNNELLSCGREAKPKSLELLEQQYRCTSQEIGE